MLNIKTMLDDFVSEIRSNKTLADIKIVFAFPFMTKPTALKETLLAVGFSDARLENAHIGQNGRAGEIKLFADIFIPIDSDAKLAGVILTNLCSSLYPLNMISVSAQRLYADSDLKCYVMKTEFTFSTEIMLGGDGGEQ